MSRAHYLKIEKTARYFVSGPLDADYQNICFALHGYGQLAKYFIQNFEDKSLNHTLFVAPEGLHRFYLEGTGGRVGASWMTKEERLSDIEDYVHYLDKTVLHFLAKTQHLDEANFERVGILGFSQGTATACRWLANSQFSFDFLINWAGAFPPDLNHEKAMESMQNIPIHLLVGNEDEYISQEKYEEHLSFLKEKGYPVKGKIFKGKHKIYTEVLKEVLKEINHPNHP